MKKPTLEEAQKIFDWSRYPRIDYWSLKMADFDPFDTTKFHIANSEVADKYRTFTRFSQEEIDKIHPISKDVAWLATHSAGIQLQFITDSRFIKVRCKNTESYGMKNMSFVGCSGFDIYVYSEEHNKFLFHRSAAFPNFIDDKKWFCPLGEFQDKKERKVLINFPLYNGVAELVIELEDGSICKPWRYENTKRIMIYGTSILQGCSSSRPGVTTTNVVSRHFQQEVLNYGFSGAANLEKEVAEIITTRDNIELIIIDPEANAGMTTKLFENLDTFLAIVYKNYPKTPVILMNRLKSQYDCEVPPNSFEGHEFNQRVIDEVVAKYKSLGKNITFVDNWNLFKDDETEFTIEGLHPNDYGYSKLNQSYIKAIEKVKKESL